jgi:hypothetical protein
MLIRLGVRNSMEKTRNCAYCLKKPARIWTGHVVRKGKKVIAGWCGRKCERKGRADGFVGLYRWRMGREEYDH